MPQVCHVYRYIYISIDKKSNQQNQISMTLLVQITRRRCLYAHSYALGLILIPGIMNECRKMLLNTCCLREYQIKNIFSPKIKEKLREKHVSWLLKLSNHPLSLTIH